MAKFKYGDIIIRHKTLDDIPDVRTVIRLFADHHQIENYILKKGTTFGSADRQLVDDWFELATEADILLYG